MAEPNLETGVGISEPSNREDFLSSLDDEEKVTPKEPFPSIARQESPPPANVGSQSGTEELKIELEDEQTKPKEELGVQWIIDERFKHLPKPEGALRTLKSQHDSIEFKNREMAKQAEETSKIVEFFDNLMDDDEYLEAFLQERKPELIQKVDRTAIIKNTLINEFPEYVEEKPTRQEADSDPGGQAWLYYKRIDELWDETKNNGKNVPTSLKSLRQQRDDAKKLQEEAALKEIQTAQSRMQYSDEQRDIFKDWAQKLSVYDLMRIHKALVKTPTRTPDLNTVHGAGTGKTARQSFLDSL